MTRFADPAILECPSCNGALIQQRLASINSFGSTYWSDGYVHTLFGYLAGKLGCCRPCEAIFWVKDAKKLGVMPKEPRSRNWSWLRRLIARISGNYPEIAAAEAAWSDAQNKWWLVSKMESPRATDVRWAVERGLAKSPEQEIYLRTLLWWAGSAPARGSRVQNPMNIEETERNKHALLALVQSNRGDDVLIEAELLRQLGRFDETVNLLSTHADRSKTASVILALAEQRSTAVGLVEDRGFS